MKNLKSLIFLLSWLCYGAESQVAYRNNGYYNYNVARAAPNFAEMQLRALGLQVDDVKTPVAPPIVEDDEKSHHEVWMASGKYQGDIIGSDVDSFNQNDQSIIDHPFDNAVKNPRSRWPDGVVPYVIDRSYSSWEQNIIRKAMKSFSTRTSGCIEFVPRSLSHRDYVYVRKGFGCYSYVGRQGGQQRVVLGRGCMHHEVVVHELLHALGFWHEQSRSDRDQHVRILWHNIRSGARGNFAKISPRVQDLLGEPYDFHSVMHYHPRAFSVNGRNTIEARDPRYTRYLGSAKRASDLDIMKLTKLYQCPTVPDEKKGGNSKGTFPTPKPLVTETTIVKRWVTTTTTTAKPKTRTTTRPNTKDCDDRYYVCVYLESYCRRPYISFIMQGSCAKTCGYCD